MKSSEPSHAPPKQPCPFSDTFPTHALLPPFSRLFSFLNWGAPRFLHTGDLQDIPELCVPQAREGRRCRRDPDARTRSSIPAASVPVRAAGSSPAHGLEVPSHPNPPAPSQVQRRPLRGGDTPGPAAPPRPPAREGSAGRARAVPVAVPCLPWALQSAHTSLLLRRFAIAGPAAAAAAGPVTGPASPGPAPRMRDEQPCAAPHVARAAIFTAGTGLPSTEFWFSGAAPSAPGRGCSSPPAAPSQWGDGRDGAQ